MASHSPHTSGENLVDAMDSRGITISELSHETGLSRTTIRKMRRGDLEGNVYSWALVAGALGISVSKLVGR